MEDEAEPAAAAAVAVNPEPPGAKESRQREIQQAALILGALLVIGASFYLGTKLNYLRYRFTAPKASKVAGAREEQFPGVAAADLVKQALAAEQAGKWDDAITRFMAAKQKDLRYRGILFRVGKIFYEHRNFDSADAAFERAIAFGENVEAANFYRGLIAVRRRDLSAAARFFEAASTTSPFTADYQYYWGEALRLDLKPDDSVPHYEQAVLLARDAQDAAVCRFKIRMARIEAAQGAAVKTELAKLQAAGPLTVDWLMTAAALELREGRVDEARKLILEARAGKAPGLFASCVNDFYFHDAAKKYPELAEALHLAVDLQVPFPD